jgi:hypothetical protein
MVIKCEGCGAILDNRSHSIKVRHGLLLIECPACLHDIYIKIESGGMGHVEMVND